MYKIASTLAFLSLFICCHCQYREQAEQEYPRRPPPAILTHKQALNHDGNFKYLFTSENGLAQGESIAPDGTRTGGYSYIDPNGKKISVKYTAGKEGFKILEADHLPKAPLPVAPLPAPQQQQAAYSQPQANNQHDDGSYRPEFYERPQTQQSGGGGVAQSYYHPKVFTQAAQPRPAYQQPQYPQYPQLQVRPTPSSNELGEKEPEYNDAPGKPYTFGSGYLFEFGSG
ncbi:endocuticle structural glycoprotein SgAbd-8-like [Anthonomus grandis grandis]|uniref:endocuticle structural glycoprotein SgAbd-8-like n=1 Tax=Anthonomus grandis grandis TaxID=2921223 RepID=UPI0021657EAE|nr:endocuticle structural glycoprotein SgAbd-8-like [Anthonomus grandis grandis]